MNMEKIGEALIGIAVGNLMLHPRFQFSFYGKKRRATMSCPPLLDDCESWIIGRLAGWFPGWLAEESSTFEGIAITRLWDPVRAQLFGYSAVWR